MDLRHVDLEPRTSCVRARIRDAKGEREVVLDAERAARVLAVAAPLVARLAARAGVELLELLETVSIDLLSRRVGVGRRDHALVDLVLVTGDATADAELREMARATLGELRGPRAAAVAPSESAFWEQLYRGDKDGWELGRPAPPLARWLAEHHDELAGRRALVVGCGRGHEARVVARAGAETVGVDFAPEAVADARRLSEGASLPLTYLQADLFALPAEHRGRYDLVVEHCCFCAVDPRRRPEYVAAVADALAPGGRLVGLFYIHGRPDGPPWGVARDELLAAFAARFTVEREELPADSIAARLGEELLLVLRRR